MSASLSPTPSIETLAPFRRSAEHPSGVPAQLEGKVPDWLRGEVVRTCPAVFETKNWRAEHWFDGLGMIYERRVVDARRHRCQDDGSGRQRNRAELDSSRLSRLIRQTGKLKR